jgi:uncharacterized protein
MYNIHSHCFTVDNICENYIPGFKTSWFKDPTFKDTALWLLHNLNPFKDDDLLDKAKAWVTVGTSGTQMEIFEQLMSHYPTGTKFVLLPMDFRFVGGGKPAQSFEDQLKELQLITTKYPEQALPFVKIDARNPNLMLDLTTCIENYGFYGIKLYPPLGYFPNDDRLMPMYEYANRKKLPIITHHGRSGVFGWDHVNRSTLKKYYKASVPSSWDWWWTSIINKSKYCTDPRNFEPILQRFPDLKICFAHLSGDFQMVLDGDTSIRGKVDDCWTTITMDYMKKYPNAYMDVSCQAHIGNAKRFIKEHIIPDKVLRSKCLFGSDWYMTTIFTSPDDALYLEPLSNYLGADVYNQLSNENCKTFLGL